MSAARGSARDPAAGPGDRFRPDLEGLRAVAVLLVLLYHAAVPGFGGGFVGVDVFFVLSGFLITGLIVREIAETGRVSLPAFYARRARRLLPAALLVIAATVVASAWLLPPLRMPGIALDGASAAVYSSNIRFALQSTDYLQADLEPSPLLHYWSLGVEEQFYLVWPALLLLAASLTPGRLLARARPPGHVDPGALGPDGWLARSTATPTARITIVVAVAGAASLALSDVLTTVAAPWAFFSLPTRAWELALGALIALGIVRLARLGPRMSVAAASLGLALIVASALIIGGSTPFPGLAALLPTLGAALVIAAGAGRHPGVPSRLLGTRPLRILGRISYSLYLWHWPLLVVPAAAIEGDLPLAVRVGLMAAAIPLAAATQRWVEEPIRHGRLVGRLPARNLALAGGLSLAVAAVSLVAGTVIGPGGSGPTVALSADLRANEQLLLPDDSPGGAPDAGSSSGPATTTGGTSGPATAGGRPGRGPATTPAGEPAGPLPVPKNLQPSLAAARDDIAVVYRDGCHLGFTQTQPGSCAYGDPTSGTTVVLFGDSHAAQWFPALLQLANANHWRLESLTKSACSAADVRVWSSALNRQYAECDAWRGAVLARIAAEHPALVVVSDDRYYQLAVNGGPVPVGDLQEQWDAGLSRTLDRLRDTAGRVVLIGDTPRSRVDPPVCLSAHLADARACATPLSRAIDAPRLDADSRVADSVGVGFVDPTPWVCPSDPCPAIIGRVLVLRDQHHLTQVFSGILARRLGDALGLPPG